MARPVWSGFLTFGLVSIPVGLFPATQDLTVHFHQIHRGTSHRIRYRKVDEVTGEEVDPADIVHGFPLGGGEYVTLTRDELRDAAPGRSETIEISDFVDLTDIDPVHFRQSYYLAPRGGGADRAYALLRQAMRQTGKLGVATLVLRDKEHLVALRPGADALILETMYFADEIRDAARELDSLPRDVSFGQRELDAAQQLIRSLTAPWSPGEYRNTYRDRVLELVDRKREGKTLVVERRPPESNVVDLAAALEASLARSAGRRARASSDAAAASAGRASPDTPDDSAARPAAGGSARRRNAKQPADQGWDPADLEAMSKSELAALAAEAHVPGRSKMTKAQLVAAIADPSAPRRVS